MKGVDTLYSFGTDEYIKSVVTKYSGLLLRIAFTRLKSTADSEDAVQEVFLKLITKQPDFLDEEHEKAWLIRATINMSCDMLRKRSRQDIELREEITASEDSASLDTSGRLLSAVLSLPEKYGTVLHLHSYEGYSIKEIAKILRLPAATVGTRLSRAKKQLKQIL